MKRLNKWLPHELTANQKKKKSSFWSIVFCYSTQQQWTIAQLDCSVRRKMDIIRQQAKTSSVAGLRRGSKALPEAKLAPKKGHGHCLMVCRLSDPPQLSESRWNHYIKYALELDEMHLKLQRLLTAWVNRKGPILLRGNTCLHSAQPKLQKLHELGYNVLPHLPHSPDLSPTDSHLFKHFDNCLQGKCFHSQQEAENAF